MKSIATIAVLMVLTPAGAAPIPAVKSARCPFGYMQSGGYCTPMLRVAPSVAPKVGRCPSRWMQRGYSTTPLGPTVTEPLHVLDAKSPGPPRQEFIELRLGGPDDLVLQHLYQPVH